MFCLHAFMCMSERVGIRARVSISHQKNRYTISSRTYKCILIYECVQRPFCMGRWIGNLVDYLIY